jgi:hypothetical protein
VTSTWDVEVTAEELAEARADAEARMTSRCTIRRRAGRTKDTDGFDVQGWTVVHTDLPVRLDSLSARGAGGYRTVTIGDSQFEVEHLLAHLPASTTNIVDRDVLEITTGEQVGRHFQVIEAGSADQKTARHVPIFEVRAGDQ